MFEVSRVCEILIESLPAGALQIYILLADEFGVVQLVSTIFSILSLGYGIEETLCRSNNDISKTTKMNTYLPLDCQYSRKNILHEKDKTTFLQVVFLDLTRLCGCRPYHRIGITSPI